jgi:hypothetical protein
VARPFFHLRQKALSGPAKPPPRGSSSKAAKQHCELRIPIPDGPDKKCRPEASYGSGWTKPEEAAVLTLLQARLNVTLKDNLAAGAARLS